MWMSWRVCLIVRESGIGWNHWKSVLCQTVKGFLIGCHWQSIIPLTVRESLIGYEFLFLFMLPMESDIWNKTNYYVSMMPPELVDCLFIQTLWKLNLLQYYVYFLYFVVLREQASVWWDCISDFGLISELSWFLYFIHVSLSCRL